MASYAYRTEKRQEKARLKELTKPEETLPTTFKPRIKSDSIHTEAKQDSTSILPANPTAVDLSVSHSVDHFRKQRAKDKKKDQQYEFVDFSESNCHVDAFKKVSFNKPETRINCFVTSFPFSGHSATDSQG
jgi:hypothetical protein